MSEDVTTAEAVAEAPTMPEMDVPPAPGAPEGEPVQLSFADLAAAVQIIDVFVTRGAIRGEEMSSVGQVRDRLQAFVQQAQAQQEAQQAEAA